MMEGIGILEKIKKAGCKVKGIRIDLGKKFIIKELQFSLEERTITHEATPGYIARQNVPKRLHYTLNDNPKAILVLAQLREKLWVTQCSLPTTYETQRPRLCLPTARPH